MSAECENSVERRRTTEGLALSDDGLALHVERYLSSMPALLSRFEREGRGEMFRRRGRAEWLAWRDGLRAHLVALLGLDRLEDCDLAARVTDRVAVDGGAIIRERIEIQVEQDVWMPLFALVPQEPSPGLLDADGRPSCFLCPHGHQGEGKFSVAGAVGIPAVDEAIARFNYDYGLKLARLGYVTLCPDARGFGERRESGARGDDPQRFLRGSCEQLAHMALPLGLTVAGLFTWDLMKLIDYVAERGTWRTDNLGCLGFPGGGMQTLWFAALDERVRKVFISGYLYGERDSLLKLSGNCACNYIPDLWRFVDMGDVASLIAPRPLIVQSRTEDHLNGSRGVVNADEQLATARQAYHLLERAEALAHVHCVGGHRFDDAHLKELLAWLERAVG